MWHGKDKTGKDKAPPTIPQEEGVHPGEGANERW